MSINSLIPFSSLASLNVPEGDWETELTLYFRSLKPIHYQPFHYYYYLFIFGCLYISLHSFPRFPWLVEKVTFSEYGLLKGNYDFEKKGSVYQNIYGCPAGYLKGEGGNGVEHWPPSRGTCMRFVHFHMIQIWTEDTERSFIWSTIPVRSSASTLQRTGSLPRMEESNLGPYMKKGKIVWNFEKQIF